MLGATIGLCLYYISDGKFTKTHAFIFFLSNYIAPDVGWVFGIGLFTHSLLFWPLFAFILAYFFYYFTRFTIKIDGIKNVEIIDLEGHKLHYLNTYLLVLSAGILHNYLDGLMNKGGSFRIIPQFPFNDEGLYWTLNDFIIFGESGILPIHILLSITIGVTLIFGFIFLFVWFLKKNSKKIGIILVFYIVIFVIFFYLAGSNITTFHSDGGAIIYISIFWLLPLILCVLSTREFKFIKRDEKGLINPKKEYVDKRLIKLDLIIMWFLMTGLFFLFASLYYLMFSEAIARRAFTNYGDQLSQYFSLRDFSMLIIMMGTINLVISLTNLFCAIGLLLKNRRVWKFTVYYNLIFSWTLIGLTIACALNEKSIKDRFNK